MLSVIHNTKLINHVVAGLHVDGSLYFVKETNDRIRTLVIIVMCSAHHVSAAKRRGVLEINVPSFCCRQSHVFRHNGTPRFRKQFVNFRISLLQHI